MRKINPAVTAGLSAAIIMGAGTAAIVGIDNMLQGDMPTAVAAQEGMPTISAEVVDEPQHNPDHTFEMKGKITVEADGHTGPFHVSWTLPDNWTSQEGTIVDINHVDGTTPGLSYSCQPVENNTGISLNVLNAGMEANNTIIIQYTVKTTPRTFNESEDADPSLADQIATMKANLSDLTLQSTGVILDTDYSTPNVAPSSSPVGNLVIGQSGNGSLTFTFTENCAGVSLSQPALSPELSGIVNLTTDTGWSLTKAGNMTPESGLVAFNTAHNYNKGDKVSINVQVNVPFSFAALTAISSGKSGTVSATCTVAGTGTVGQIENPVPASSAVSLGYSSLTAGKPLLESEIQNVTNPGIKPTTGDVIKVPIRVQAPHGAVRQSGILRVALSNVGAAGVKITSVESSTNGQAVTHNIQGDGSYVDITVPSISANGHKDYYIFVTCGDVNNATLNGKSIAVNADAAIFTNSIKSVAELQSTSPALYTINIAAPTATIESAVTDSSLVVQNQQSAFSTEMTSNLGDTAIFKITFKNDSDRTIKGVTLEDELHSFSKDGGVEYSNDTACVDILTTPHEITLTKVSGTGAGATTTSVPVTANLTPATLAEHPWKLQIVPGSPLNLRPNESLVLQYSAQMGHTNITASSQNMRGATVINNPRMHAQNFVDGTSVQASDITKSSVKIATAQLSARLDATKDKIGLGEKTTYFVTVQSVEQKTTTYTDEYAIGLHLTSILDEHSRSFGYKYDKGSVKLYHVSNDTATAVPTNDYAVAWVEPEAGSNTLKEMSFTVDIKDGKEGLYKIKNVVVSNPNTNKVGGESALQEALHALAVRGESTEPQKTQTPLPVQIANMLSAEASTVNAESSNDTDSDKGDVKTLAKQIHDGFIITYDGTTDHVDAALAGELPTNTDVLVRADNAGFSVDSKGVTIVGEDIRMPTTGWKADPNAINQANGQNPNDPNNPNNPNNPSNRNGAYAPLIGTDASIPVSIGAVLTGIAGWAVTKYRKIKRR